VEPAIKQVLIERALLYLQKGIILINKEDEVVYVNNKLSDFYDSIVEGAHFKEALVGEEIFDLYDELHKDGNALSCFLTIPIRGSSKWISVQITGSLISVKGEKYSILEFTDISEQIGSDRSEMLNLRRMSKIGVKASQIIHDLKNPLGAILGLTDLMLSEGDNSKYTYNIRSTSMAALSSLDELNAFASGRRVPLSKEEVNVQEWLENIAESFYIKNFIVVVPGDNITVSLNRQKMETVLWNLITNARDVLAERDDGQIKLSYSENVNSILFKVSDNGPGIPKELQNSLFTPGKTSGKKDGRGIGLSSVMEIVKLHSGNISWESDSNGTTFIIELPKK
jgi:two-component system nitrogen regulation sensor histidine kinase GlnL